MTKAVANKRVPLNEECTLAESKVDREAGVVRNVKVLGAESRNGRTYTTEAMQQASRLYEGVGVNINHPERSNPNRERRFEEGFGELKNVRVENGAVYADLHYPTKHALAEDFAERAEKFPNQLGLSHNAEGSTVSKGGKTFVDSIERVRSVDIVRSPATNKSLFESEDQPVKKTLKQILETIPESHKLRTLLVEMDAAMPDMQVEMPAEANAEDSIKAAFRQAVVAAFDDDKLDTQATLGKIKEILKAYEKVSGDAPAPESKPDEGGEGKPKEDTPESKIDKDDPMLKQLQEQLSALQAKDKAHETEKACRKLIESAGHDVTDARLQTLSALPNDELRKAAIKEWAPKVAKSQRPAFSPPILESSNDSYDELKKRVKALA